MYFGLDLGTGLAKLASVGARESTALTVVPTALTYRGRLTSEIPAGWSDTPGAVRCDGFPAMLDGGRAGRQVAAWGSRTPSEVTQGFLMCLLEGTDASERPSDVVAAVPPAGSGADRAQDTAQDTGTEVRDILTALGRTPRRLVAAPVAALLHLRRELPALAAASRFVVCDTGAGSAEFSLCTAGEHAIRVTDSIRVSGALALADDTPFSETDRTPTLAECLVATMAGIAEGRRAATAGALSVRRWRALERTLDDDAQRDRLDVVLQQAAATPHRHGSAVAIRFADLEVTATQLLEACAPLARRSAAALRTLLARQDDPEWYRFAGERSTRIVLIGGLDGLRPLRDALLAASGLDPDRPGEAVVEPGPAERAGAAARGAALVAAGEADPGDRYPHAIQVAVNRVVRDRVVATHLELATGGTIDLEQAETSFLTEAGERVLVTVRQASAPASPLLVQVVRGGDPVPAVLCPAAPPRPGVYHIGVRGGPEGPAVVLQNIDGSKPLTYTLKETAS